MSRPVVYKAGLPPVAKRDVCQFCRKPLRPRLEQFLDHVKDDELPAALLRASTRYAHVQSHRFGWSHTIEVWDAVNVHRLYQGYGSDTFGAALFCTLQHGVKFASAAYANGFSGAKS